jgi:hypothetical protein
MTRAPAECFKSRVDKGVEADNKLSVMSGKNYRVSSD